MNHTGMLPLKGVRVLDLSRVLAGPLCAQTLGSLGADVIKVEPCGVGDETREWSPYRQGTGTAYLAVNLNKKGMALNLKTPEGLKIVHELVRMSDVVIESNSTGVSERLGIDYESLRKIKADIVYCSISGFGQTGPLKDAKGYDLMLQAFSGIMAMTGNPDGGPIRIPFSPIDQVTSLNAVIGVLSALMRRGQTGEGARVEVSLFDTSVSLVGYLLQAYWQNGELPKRIGCEHPSLAPYQAFDAADKPILVGIANDALWQRFCSAFGIAHAASDERFRTNRQRVLHRAETVKLVQDIVKQHRAADLLERLIAIGVPCAPINTLGDLADHEHTAARRMTFSYEHSSLGTIQAVAQPISYDGHRQTAVNPPPALGEHTEEILRMLGYEHSEIAELVSRGAVACA